MTHTPAVAYCHKRFKTAGREEIYTLLDDAPLRIKDYAFLSDVIEGLSNQQLAAKYHKSPSRISQWKRSVFEQIHEYELHRAEWERSRIVHESTSNRENKTSNR